MHVQPAEEFFPTLEVAEGDSSVFTITHRIARGSPNRFTLHVLFLYKNEAGSLYDTYYWATFRVDELIAKQRFVEDEGRVLWIQEYSQADINQYIQMENSHQSSVPYDLQQSQDILEFLDHGPNSG